MKAWLGLLLLFLIGCGGSTGGSTQVHLTGIVLWLKTAGAPTPPPAIQVGTFSQSANSDGSFDVLVGRGATNLLITYTPTSGAPVTFAYTFPPITADTDLGDIFIGPEKITLAGSVKSTVDSSAIEGASVLLNGKTVTTAANGSFVLTEVPYDSTAPTALFTLTGLAGKSGFFTRQFNPDATPVGGTATMSDILLQPDSGTQPPDTPYVIFGSVGPSSVATGATVDLLQGSTVIRRFTVTADHVYGFWVPTGTYTIRASKSGGLTAPDITVTLSAPTQVLRRDVTLN